MKPNLKRNSDWDIDFVGVCMIVWIMCGLAGAYWCVLHLHGVAK
jgi:hypothetical protein